jgi:hypothetical protein
MRRVLLVVVLGLLLGAGLMALIERDPGLVVISYGDTTVETSVWLALVLWLLVWGLLAFSLRLLRGAWTLRGSVSGWLGGRKARNASALTNRGLISFIEGNWSRSRRQLLRAARYSKAPCSITSWRPERVSVLGTTRACSATWGRLSALSLMRGLHWSLPRRSCSSTPGTTSKRWPPWYVPVITRVGIPMCWSCWRPRTRVLRIGPLCKRCFLSCARRRCLKRRGCAISNCRRGEVYCAPIAAAMRIRSMR